MCMTQHMCVRVSFLSPIYIPGIKLRFSGLSSRVFTTKPSPWPVNINVSIHLCVHMHAYLHIYTTGFLQFFIPLLCVHIHATARMWKSEDNCRSQVSLLPSPHQDSNSGLQDDKILYPESAPQLFGRRVSNVHSLVGSGMRRHLHPVCGSLMVTLLVIKSKFITVPGTFTTFPQKTLIWCKIIFLTFLLQTYVHLACQHSQFCF